MTKPLIQLVESLGTPKVLVLGDLIVDRYVWGDAERISQEAPVVLLRADQREERLGGAASVATMLSALGAQVALAGVVGDDETGRQCRKMLQAAGIDQDLVLADPSRPTTLKERYIGRAQHKHPQQMMRVDYEVRDAIAKSLSDRLVADLENVLPRFDVVLVSDYDKGVCTPELVGRLIEAARRCQRHVLVDPIRGGDYGQRYRGCSAMTPNRLEAGLATGIEIATIADAFLAADQLRHELDMEVGIITLDTDGMVLVDASGQGHHFPIRARQVYDITGAGDMVLAVLGVVLAVGYGYPEAIQLANAAGGLEVERIGVATVTRAEIIHDLLQSTGSVGEKLVSQEVLLAEIENHRRAGKSIVFTNGCFDILHAGHVHYLREARAQGDLLVVGLNTDTGVRRLGKGPDRPVNGQDHRALVLGAVEYVDYVCLFEEETPLELIRAVRPDVLVKGADYRPEEVVGKDLVESFGGRLHLAGLVPDCSTTNTLHRLGTARRVA